MATGNQASPACGCCQAPSLAAPLPIFNRPALSAIAYRTGEYAAFRQAMIQAIPTVDAELARARGLTSSPLGRWTARQRDDYGIAVLELWAVLGDVLTFYQERIANEAFLRTAVQRDSIRRLAAMLDYRLDPGVAAATLLAYTLGPGAAVQVPVGLRAKSVPGQDETPQVFETVEAIEARDVLNRVPVHPKPEPDDPLSEPHISGALAPDSPVPFAGDRLLLYGEPDVAPAPEEKVVERVEQVRGRTVVTWSPPVANEGWSGQNGHLTGYRRTFGVFGSDAPSEYLVPVFRTDSNEIIGWELNEKVTDFYKLDFDADNPTLPLDGIHDVVVGDRLLIRVPDEDDLPDEGHLCKVTAVGQRAETLGILSANVTVLTLDTAPPDLADRRTAVVYLLAAQDLAFLDWTVPTLIGETSGVLYAEVTDLPALEGGRAILVDDDAGRPQLLTVTGDAKKLTGSTTPGHDVFLEIPVRPPLERTLQTDSAHLLGNVAAATHGETVRDEVVGSGNGSAAFLAFTLAKQPLTRVRSAAAPGGALSTLSFRSDQVEWREVPSLYGQPPTARVYTTEVDDEGRTTISTGDGITGARPPTGVNNLTAVYRHGQGDAGNLDPGRITIAVDRPAGLKSVTNPVAADGGADPETTALAKRNAPTTVRTFDRAVSLRDFEDLASGFAGVAKVKATVLAGRERPTVQLTVAGPGGALLSDRHREDLRDYLDQRRDPNRAVLTVVGYTPALVTLEAIVQADPAHPNAAVEAAARAAVKALFAFEAREFGQGVPLSDVYAALQAAQGVVAADVNELDPTTVGATELAVLADPAVLGVTATGGLPS